MKSTIILTAALLAAATACDPAHADTPGKRRPPNPSVWQDHCNLAGDYASPEEICRAKQPYYEKPLEYVPQSAYHGYCAYREPYSNYFYYMVAGGFPFFSANCPSGYWMKNYVRQTGCGLDAPQYYSYGPDQYCEAKAQIIDVIHPEGRTCVGNPIFPLTGAKSQQVRLGSWLGLPLDLVYDTRSKLPVNDDLAAFQGTQAASFGPMWSSSLHRRLVIQTRAGGTRPSAQASRGGGTWVSFYSYPSSYEFSADVVTNDRITRAVMDGWTYLDAKNQSLESYDASGRLTQIKTSAGQTHTFEYSTSSTPASTAPAAGLLIAVKDPFGRQMSFRYEQPAETGLAPWITSLTTPGGKVFSFSYDTVGNLTQVSAPDGTAKRFLYENPALPWALTGVTDEAGARTGTYGYDADGRATSTEGAAGTNKYSVNWSEPPKRNIVETYDEAADIIWRHHYWVGPTGLTVNLPNGQSSALGVTTAAGMPRVSSRSQPAGSGCGASSSAEAFDAQGNTTQVDDFTGLRTCYAHDLSRNLETSRVEGLANTQACSAVTPLNAELPPGSRKISTAWHPDWHSAVKVAEPRRLTTNVYNGQPDPFAGNAIAKCAPDVARLPNSKSIAVLCKTVEQATYDASGAAGLAASLDTSVPNHVWSYTYNEFGQVLTSRDPRGNSTTNSYYATTTADYTRGDLEKTTGALPTHVTRFTKYNPMGQVLQSIDPNGVTTDYEYDLRQRLKRQTTAGQSTIYDYWPTGQLKRVTQPGASYVDYEYDPAQRLVAVADNLGNRIEYSLDNSGRHREERVKDPSGLLKRQVSRVFDALGRTQQITGRE